MKYYVLASGSKENCTVIQSNNTTIMIDCGMSKRKTIKKLESIGLTLDDIKYVLITHEHSDHIKGIKMFDLSKIYAAKGTIEGLEDSNIVEARVDIELDDLKIKPLSISHDATNPLAYIIQGDETLLYMTDTGYIARKNYSFMKNMNYYIFESNYDIELLMASNRPDFLKSRILGDKGHLENTYSAKVMSDIIGKDTKEIVLAHLSEHVNTKKKALSAYKKIFNNYNIDFDNIRVATQDDILIGGN